MDEINTIDEAEQNEILLHAVTNGWYTQSYLQGWDLESKKHKETWDMFERMEIAEQFYKGGTPFKIINQEYANRKGHTRNIKGGEASSP